MDESGTPAKPEAGGSKYFVVGGLIVPEAKWHGLRDGLHGLKVRHGVRGELKWRYFAPSNDDRRNPMRELAPDARNAIRADVYKLIATSGSLTTIACVVSHVAAYGMQSITCQDDVYHLGYKGLTERFQYHLQDMSRSVGRKEFGIVVADHRGSNDDRILRQVHQKLLYAKSSAISSYDNLVEGLFLEPSHLSVGIQLADMVAGAVWRKFERDDATWFDALEPTLRRSPAGSTDGWGIVRNPKGTWK